MKRLFVFLVFSLLYAGIILGSTPCGTMDYGEVSLAGGYKTGNFPELWDLTKGDLIIKFTVNMQGMVDRSGAHAWAELGIREMCYGNFNPAAGHGVWLATDYDWTPNTFAPDVVPTQDIDDKFILQKVAGQGEGSYNINFGGNQWLNYGIWFDRDGVDQWQATNWGMIDGKTYNTNGIYSICIHLHANHSMQGTAMMTVNGVQQGFYDTWRNGPPHHWPSGVSFVGDMTKMQVFYGLYGYGATHSVTFSDIEVKGYSYLPKPVADFTANQTAGIEEVCVQFLNISHYACSYLWDFGDGCTSTSINPKHCYQDNQKHYDVKLTAYGPGGEACVLKKGFITVYHPTEVMFNGSPIAGKAPLKVNFMNHTGGAAQMYCWDYGDDVVEEYRHGYNNKVHPEHTYVNPGVYTPKLTANGFGGEDILMVPNMIYVTELVDYLNMMVVEGGATYPKEGWENAIDHDIKSLASGFSEDAWVKFMFADSLEKKISEIRLLVDNIDPIEMHSNLTKDFEVWTSLDGTNWGEAPVCSATTDKKNCEWDHLMLETPVNAKYVMLKLLSSRAKYAEFYQIAEFQVFGEAVTLAKNVAELNDAALPTSFALDQNYPNPFNPETNIRFQLPENADISLQIYNLQGQAIRTIYNGNLSAGYHTYRWDAKDDIGVPVAGGIYLYKLRISNGHARMQEFTNKMVLMK
ncbi:T9SS type A sorting domain-containing protein [candidate division KSB1 bacterium]|nr:T9SS type A sorting domain-containing protein [candidate division KSB1 bacterium]